MKRVNDAMRAAAPVLTPVGVAFLAILLVFLRLESVPTSTLVPPTPGSAGRLIHRDTTGLEVAVPADWVAETAVARASDGEPDRTTTYRAPDGTKVLAISAWEPEPDRAPLPLWVAVTASHLRAVDDGPLPNATLAGVPAAVVWQPADGIAPAEYAAFLERDGHLFRIGYHENPPGGSTTPFREALTSLQWSGARADNTIPPLP